MEPIAIEIDKLERAIFIVNAELLTYGGCVCERQPGESCLAVVPFGEKKAHPTSTKLDG